MCGASLAAGARLGRADQHLDPRSRPRPTHRCWTSTTCCCRGRRPRRRPAVGWADPPDRRAAVRLGVCGVGPGVTGLPRPARTNERDGGPQDRGGGVKAASTRGTLEVHQKRGVARLGKFCGGPVTLAPQATPAFCQTGGVRGRGTANERRKGVGSQGSPYQRALYVGIIRASSWWRAAADVRWRQRAASSGAARMPRY